MPILRPLFKTNTVSEPIVNQSLSLPLTPIFPNFSKLSYTSILQAGSSCFLWPKLQKPKMQGVAAGWQFF